MNEYGPAKSVPTEFETTCLDNIRLSLESDTISEASLQELKDLLARVEKLVCPSQCSQNGRCVDSKCQCNEGRISRRRNNNDYTVMHMRGSGSNKCIRCKIMFQNLSRHHQISQHVELLTAFYDR